MFKQASYWRQLVKKNWGICLSEKKKLGRLRFKQEGRQEQEIVKSFSDNPGPKALSIPWTADWKKTCHLRIAFTQRQSSGSWQGLAKEESPSISFNVFGYFRILSTLSNVQTYAQCLPTWQLYLSFQTFQVQLQSSKQSNRVLQIIAFIVSCLVNMTDGPDGTVPVLVLATDRHYPDTRWRKHEVEKKW